MDKNVLAPEVARRYRRYFDDAIMSINAWRPMDAKERKRDYLYGAFLVLFFLFVPLASVPVTVALGKPMIGVIITIAGWSIALGVGLSKRRGIIARFYEVDDAVERTHFIEGEDFDAFLEQHGLFTIAFILGANELSADFIFNWLHRHGAIKDGHLDIHCFDAVDLARRFPLVFQQPTEDTSILCIPFDELVMDAENGARLGHESDSVGAKLLAQLQ